MSATESLGITMGTGVTVPPPIFNAEACAAEYMQDYAVNWRSPFRPAYQCVIGEDLTPGCVRRGTFGGVPSRGFGVSGVTSVLAPRAFPLYPSCTTCMNACTLKAAELGG
jgi:hypothetical protein